MTTFMFVFYLVLFLYLIPAPWSRWLWSHLLSGCYERSTLKVGVEKAGVKLRSFKDVAATKANAPKEG